MAKAEYNYESLSDDVRSGIFGWRWATNAVYVLRTDGAWEYWDDFRPKAAAALMEREGIKRYPDADRYADLDAVPLHC